jgi:RNA polymerase sigma-70 factor (ECF subfamily)
VEGGQSLERAYREEATRVRAALAAWSGDVGLAEDALQDAFVEAAEHWPREGTPANPGGWLTITARHKALDRIRREKSGAAKLALLASGGEDAVGAARGDGAGHADGIGGPAGDASRQADDELLSLAFACCHPALPRDAQVALTLRAVCGLTTGEIAAAFLVSEPAMSQRLLRARKTLGQAEVKFAIPDPDELNARLVQVLEVVYLVFNEGYLASSGRQPARRDLAAQAIALTRTLHRLMPNQPEVLGLLALLLLHESRAAVRFDGWGRLIRLRDQDRSKWDKKLTEEATALLDHAIAMRRHGPYQVQAAIAALHAQAQDYGQTDWRQIRLLYGTLQAMTPSPVVLLNRAVATRYAIGPEAALGEIEPLAAELDGYHLFHALRAALLTALGRDDEASEASERALALTANPAERDLLARGLSVLPPLDYPISTRGRSSTVIQPRSTPGQVFAISTASFIDATSSTEKPPTTSLVSMYGPSVTPDPRTVLAVFAGCSCAPPSASFPDAPVFSYQSPTSANHSLLPSYCSRPSGVSMISITYFTLGLLPMGCPSKAPSRSLSLQTTNGQDTDPTRSALLSFRRERERDPAAKERERRDARPRPHARCR